jgi:hypothetical protein
MMDRRGFLKALGAACVASGLTLTVGTTNAALGKEYVAAEYLWEDATPEVIARELEMLKVAMRRREKADGIKIKLNPVRWNYDVAKQAWLVWIDGVCVG